MHFSTIFTALLLAIAPEVAIAKSCKRGGVYCGQSLLNRGNYWDHIVETLQASGQPTDDAHVRASIFDCLSDGDIRYRGYCSRGCGGVGSDDADYCL
ncbi:hypothetical protein CYLTODRAFT_350996 [Cylindrobasidium torrendii FP15055 ss-10]|uniref:Uncharacterized protein n=1 Tax=Cylindrobasidium torrendii FP15055 ss-10 TaxID=1314674 RepID=A0A0D7BDM2_9AGAR|nr:hypothetical protein CYLTODRAFT_350996 [Cylindrobasidium torrendii FP15055 ss-10]